MLFKPLPVLQSKAKPRPRADPFLALLPPRRLVLFAGLTQLGVSNELWIGSPSEDLKGLLWQSVPTLNAPSLLSFSAVLVDQFLYIYGGQSMNQAFLTTTESALYKLDVLTGVCQLLIQTGELPGPRNSAGLAYSPSRNSLLLTGGSDQKMTTFPGLWEFALDSLRWTHLKIEGPQPYRAGLWGHSCFITERQYPPLLKEGVKPMQLIQVLSRQDVTEHIEQGEGPFLTIVGGCSEPSQVYPALTQISLKEMRVTAVRRISPACMHKTVDLGGGRLLRVGGMDGSRCIGPCLILPDQQQKGVQGPAAVGMGVALLQGKLFTFGGADEAQFHGLNLYELC